MNAKWLKTLLGFLALTMAATGLYGKPARADLTIMPVRVVFNDRERSAEITLVNSSQTTNTYRLEWLHNRMKPDGTYEALSGPLSPAFDPEQHIVFSPRQVTIPPGQRQQVRISLRRPADLPPGEYRGHLTMRSVGQESRRERAVGSTTPSGVTARVNVNVGFSIPIIVRQGPYDAAAQITDIALQPPQKAGGNAGLTLTLNRTGLNSTTGRVLVFWTPPGAEERQIGVLNNVNVFPELEARHIRVALTNEQPLTGGVMRIRYEGTEDERGILYDEEVLPLQ